ncbi:MAG: AbrB/MazE/SpoVT family DNA-binding domain-containing protein [Candidatus Aminicenantes bacterium]|nr:AbrB/MazE/SpoVT family DNA-binding domain-containing protein [Candidatus Aminicenantes bacterium]
MSLMRGFSRIDKEGRIVIPKNIRKESHFEEGKLVEIKLQGSNLAQYISIRARKQVR